MASQVRTIERAAKAGGIKSVTRVLLLEDDVPRVARRDFNAIAEAEVLMGGLEAASEDALRRLGNLNVLAQWAYALTSTHREDHDDPITYREFRRLLPTDGEGIQQLMELVGAVLNPPGMASEGNAPAPSDSEPTAESTGDGTTTSEPSPSDAPITTSGE